MAIDTNCPFCRKAYRLRDDLDGKKVTCANQECRKVFTVTGVATGAARAATGSPNLPSRKPEIPPEQQIDADALAAAALAEEDDAAGPEDTRTIEMTCTFCEHQWSVAWSMQGKNALCPDCKSRVRVPEQKKVGKADWRDARQPSLARVEKLEGVQATNDSTFISGQTIRDAGLVEVEYEPRPASFYLKYAALGLLVVGTIGTLIFWTVRDRTAQREDQFVLDFRKAVESEDLNTMTPDEATLYRGTLYLLAGQYAVRIPDQQHRDQAIRDFGEARVELEKARRSQVRDLLLVELAIAITALGGDDEAVLAKSKLNWVPTPPRNARAQVKPSAAEAEGVQGQLRRVFQTMRQERAPAEYEARALAARRVARQLVKPGQVQMLVDTLHAGFAENEIPEIRGQLGLILLQSGDQEGARQLAEDTKTLLTAMEAGSASPSPASLQALWLALEPPISSPTITSAPGPGEPSEVSRLAFSLLKAVQKQPDEAMQIAGRPGKGDARLKALAYAAEFTENQAPLVDKAAELLAAEQQKKDSAQLPSGIVLARLAMMAASAGQPDKAEQFTKVILDEGLREWTRAEVLHGQLERDRAREAKEEDAPLPDDLKKYRIGHAWARFQIARHNAARTQDRALAQKYSQSWPGNVIPSFGHAGVALGIQDAELRE